MPKFLFEIVDPKSRNRKVSVEAPTVKQATELLGSKGLEIVRHIEPEPVFAVRTDAEPLAPKKEPEPFTPPQEAPRQTIDVRLVSVQLPFWDIFDVAFKGTIASFLAVLLIGFIIFGVLLLLSFAIGFGLSLSQPVFRP